VSERKSSLAPVVDTRTRLLVLGSLPGEESLARARYYAHPRNQFWTLIGSAIGRDLQPLDYEARIEALLAAGVGLWDTVASATRAGSLDGAIRDHAANDVAALAATLPQLRAVAFNGGKSAAIGLRLMAGSRYDLVPLPSSSPAYTLALADKQKAWAKLREYL
jgi:hypoxanthine-DNA glycosylase